MSLNIAIVPKLTKLEWDKQRLKLSYEGICAFYKKERINAEHIIASHERQKAAFEELKHLLPEATVLEHNHLSQKKFKKYDIVVSFGGDNHFQYVAHFLTNQHILGINSDPQRSEGALAQHTISALKDKIQDLMNKSYATQLWTRLAIEINGKKVSHEALSEIFIGEEKRTNMSRHILQLKSQEEEQKGSGLIVATGTGSTGWYASATRHLALEAYSRSAQEIRFVLTEPFNGRIFRPRLNHGTISYPEKLKLISLSDTQAVVVIDALTKIKILEGAHITIGFGTPLNVVRFNVPV